MIFDQASRFLGFLTHFSTSKLAAIDLSGNQLIGFVNATPGFTFTSCQLVPNLALECPLPSGCKACTCGMKPSCASTCTGVGIYPGNWTFLNPCPTTPTPSAMPLQTSVQSTSQLIQSSTSTNMSTSTSGNVIAQNCLYDPTCIQGNTFVNCAYLLQ